MAVALRLLLLLLLLQLKAGRGCRRRAEPGRTAGSLEPAPRLALRGRSWVVRTQKAARECVAQEKPGKSAGIVSSERQERREALHWHKGMGIPRHLTINPTMEAAEKGADPGPPRLFQVIYTTISQPGQRMPKFIAVGYMGGEPIAHYDSETKVLLPQAAWMEKMLEEEPQYWGRYTKMLQRDEKLFYRGLRTRQTDYNQSAGFHTWQMMAGCEVGRAGPRGQYFQFGYDGRDFLSMDMETHTWTAADTVAQVSKTKWEARPYSADRFRAYVEDTCAEWLEGEKRHGTGVPERREPPEVRVTRKAGYGNTETLACRAHGFYPQEIDMEWTRDGKVWLPDTFRGVLAPNSDGTYHAWVGIRITPAERGHFRCCVGHDALPEPLNVAWEEPGGANWGLIMGCATGPALLGFMMMAGILLCCRKRQGGYKAASGSGRWSNSSGGESAEAPPQEPDRHSLHTSGLAGLPSQVAPLHLGPSVSTHRRLFRTELFPSWDF